MSTAATAATTPTSARVILSGQKRGITPTIRRERRRRNAIEPVIGHMKSDGHLGRNFLLGTEGDAANVILAAAGHNLRLLRAWLARLLAFLLGLLAHRSTGAVPPPRRDLRSPENRVLHGRRPTPARAAGSPCEGQRGADRAGEQLGGGGSGVALPLWTC